MSALAIGTRIEGRELAAAGTPLMERVCSYCHTTLGWVVCCEENAGERSHGACGPCAEKELATMRAAARYLSREYTLEIGSAGDEPATQAATPPGSPGREDNALAGADNTNATEALRGPVSSSLPTAGGADVRDSRGVCAPTENAPDGGSFLSVAQN